MDHLDLINRCTCLFKQFQGLLFSDLTAPYQMHYPCVDELIVDCETFEILSRVICTKIKFIIFFLLPRHAILIDFSYFSSLLDFVSEDKTEICSDMSLNFV